VNAEANESVRLYPSTNMGNGYRMIVMQRYRSVEVGWGLQACRN